LRLLSTYIPFIRHRPLYAGDPIFEKKMGCPDKPGNDEIELVMCTERNRDHA
jgi:hypothetical protein